MLRIAWLSSLATESDTILPFLARSPLSGIVLVTISFSIGALSIRSNAGPDSTPCTAHAKMRPAPFVFQRVGRLHDRARRVDDVVLDDARPAGDVADHVHHFRRAVIAAALVDHRQLAAEALRIRARALGAAGVGRHDRQVRKRHAAPDDR